MQGLHGGNRCKKQQTPLRMEEQREEVKIVRLRSPEKKLSPLGRGCFLVGASLYVEIQ